MQRYVSREAADTLRYKTRRPRVETARVLGYKACMSTLESSVKRMLAIVAFLAGGLAAELAHPVQCLLLTPARVQFKRKKP